MILGLFFFQDDGVGDVFDPGQWKHVSATNNCQSRVMMKDAGILVLCDCIEMISGTQLRIQTLKPLIVAQPLVSFSLSSGAPMVVARLRHVMVQSGMWGQAAIR